MILAFSLHEIKPPSSTQDQGGMGTSSALLSQSTFQ